MYAQTNPINEAISKRLVNLTTKHNVFTDDLKYYIVKELLGGNKTKFAKMMLDQNVLQMSTK